MKFSDERELFAAASMLREPPAVRSVRPAPREYVKLAAESRWAIFWILVAAIGIGSVASVAIRPQYESTLLIQIADSIGSPKSFLGEASTAFDIKTPATAEMEIMRSRMVVSPAVEKHRLLVVAKPRLFPWVGHWLAPDSEEQPPAGALRIGRWVHGAQAIDVGEFEVPAAWEGRSFVLRAEGDGRFTLEHRALEAPLRGKVGERLTGKIGSGQLSLLVTALTADPGATFTLERKPHGKAVEDLQDALRLTERGRQSGIIEIALRDTNASRAAAVLNAIGANYVRQDLDRKTIEAEKAIAFLNGQLPSLKQQMDRAEDAYSSYRSRKGTLWFEEEAKIAIERSADLRGRLAEAQQRRRDLLQNYGGQHPSVKIVDEQIAGIEREISRMQSRISTMPSTQQDAGRLERDVKLNGDLYQQLRTSLLQLQLVREGRSGNARIIDPAIAPDDPVRPKPPLILGVAGAAGLLTALLYVLVRTGLARGVRSTRDIEAGTGMNVYPSTIPLGRPSLRVRRGAPDAVSLGADSGPLAVGLRQLRTALHYQMRERKNNRLLLTGPTEGVGVHFLAANLGVLFAASGRRIVVVDADPRRDSLARRFGLREAPGLAELVAGTATPEDVIQSTGVEGLNIVSAGASAVAPDRLTASRAFHDLMEHASKEHDLVLLAAPPILRSAETLALAASAMVVLVARARRTSVEEITESARRLSQAGQVPSGIVLNAI